MSAFFNRPTQNHHLVVNDFETFDEEDDEVVELTSAAARTIPTTIPGGYQLESQTYDSLPAPVVSHSTRPSSRSSNTTTATTSSSTSSSDNNSNSIGSNARSFLASRLPTVLAARFGLQTSEPTTTAEGHGLLFSSVEEEEEDDEEAPARSTRSTYPPSNHIPLPARPHSFPAPRVPTGRVFGGGQGNDGVFANLSAKPDQLQGGRGIEFVGGDDGNSGDKEEVPPNYATAALDTTPPYWETTVLTPPGILGPDDICVDGLPVGNFFGFAWNLLVSMSFQFVGFFLTYLLHTTHAAKNGSRAGLGITLIQLGFYLKQRSERLDQIEITSGDATGLAGSPGPAAAATAALPTHLSSWSWWTGNRAAVAAAPALATPTSSAFASLPTQISSVFTETLTSSDATSVVSKTLPSLGDVNAIDGSTMNEIMAFALVMIGSFLVIGALLNYWRAVRTARAMQAGMGAGADMEATVAME